ncbi:MAG: tRNA pseudouridine(38-40) synthase TruA [Betaproteobacteria bacterium]|nr:tRNA pseudouridine(38-40) synthase TruA [Betaproteobacteria bacterium]
MRIALGLEYDGSRFCGWQSQPSGCSVQDALEAALSRIAGSDVRVTSAGRTDSGVHALTQVVHFDTGANRPLSAWVRGVNAQLPGSVAALWAREVAADFHARFSARSRTYYYLLLNRPVRPGLGQRRVGWFHLPLELERMQEAARPLLGSHDFSAFRAAECQAKSPVKDLYRADISRQGELFVFEFRANAFLHHMVRNIVGCLVYVGKGRYPVEWVRQLLEQRDRTLAAPTFAPDGLYLAGIEYDAAWGVPRGELALNAIPVYQWAAS